MKTLKDFENYFHANIFNVIKEANENTDCRGYGILLPHYSINTSAIRGEELDWLWSELEEGHGISMQVSQYDDLVIFTDQYEGEFDI